MNAAGKGIRDLEFVDLEVDAAYTQAPTCESRSYEMSLSYVQ